MIHIPIPQLFLRGMRYVKGSEWRGRPRAHVWARFHYTQYFSLYNIAYYCVIHPFAVDPSSMSFTLSLARILSEYTVSLCNCSWNSGTWVVGDGRENQQRGLVEIERSCIGLRHEHRSLHCYVGRWIVHCTVRRLCKNKSLKLLCISVIPGVGVCVSVRARARALVLIFFSLEGERQNFPPSQRNIFPVLCHTLQLNFRLKVKL